MKEISRISLRKLDEAEVPQALSILEDAFEEDPLQVYFRETPNHDDEPIYRTNWRERMRDMLRMAIRNDLAWTTDDVGAILTYSVDSESSANADNSREQGQGPAPASRVLASTPLSEELIKRLGEWKSKIDKAIADNLGDRRKDMMAIDLLATAPMKQGRGYASALIRKVLDEADLRCQNAWLISSNSENIGFYSYHGFTTKAEIVVGENNPTWDRQPVRIYLMLREAQQQ